MQPTQFSLRFLFRVTFVVSTAIVVLQFGAARFPWALLVAAYLSVVFGCLGLIFILFAALIAISITLEGDDGNRSENLGYCRRLAFVGLLATAPFACLWIAMQLS